jgi:hypothetical protein
MDAEPESQRGGGALCHTQFTVDATDFESLPLDAALHLRVRGAVRRDGWLRDGAENALA